MIRMIQRRLIIPRGDTGSFSIPYLKAINPGDVAVFTIFDIRTKTKMYQKLIAAEGDILNIAFTHGDTVNLKPGKYLWDIKFYTNPRIVDDELVDGDEVDSYYAGFSLPECEIRETGDALLTSDDAPTSTISPESLNIINAAINEILITKKTAVDAAETASLKADAAAESAEDASNSASAASQSAALAEARVNEIENLSVEVDTGLEGTDASVTYTPSTGVLSFIIPRGNTGNGIASCVLNNDFTLTINYTNGTSTTTIPIRGDTPHLTIGEVTEGPHAIATITGTDANPILNLTLPNANVPTKLSQLTDDIGVAGKANSADLAAVATSGSYTDLGDKPYIPVKTSDLTNDSNYAVDSNYVHTDNNYTTAEKNKLSGIAAGAEVNVNADWNANSGDAQILNKPTKVSDFTNDAGYLTEHQDISGKADKSEIPTKVSQLQNDSGYLTSYTETDPTVPAWAKAATKPSYTAAEVGAPTVAEMQQAIANVNTMKIHICAQGEYNSETGVPTIQNPNIQTFYLVPGGEGSNLFIEWVYVNSAWERFGSADVEISVQDVQINGTSIVSNGIANIQKASSSNLGVVGIELQSGVIITSSGKLEINPASTADIKKGENTNKPIVPFKQDVAAFYGLATAAGDATQSVSNNPVGTYTNEAKAAIQQMLDVPAKSDIPEVPVTDVQINGTSILNDGIANVPMASANNLGLVKINNNYGIVIDPATGNILTYTAGSNIIKEGTNQYRPIVPRYQQNAVFYGLATAAGDTTQSQSSNSIGSYTDIAKEKIQSMLGITQMLAPENPNLVATQAYSIEDVFAANGHLYKATAAIAANGAIITDGANANCIECNISDNLSDKVAKAEIDYAGISQYTYSTKFGGEFSVTTATTSGWLNPYARASVTGRINKENMHRVTVNGTKYILRTRLWYEKNNSGFKVYEYLGNLGLYIESTAGVPGGTDNVPFIIISDLNNSSSIDVITQTAGAYTILVEQINPTKIDLPKSLIWGDSYAPIEKNNNGGTYNGFSLGVNELNNKRGTFAIGYANKIEDELNIAIGNKNAVSGKTNVIIGSGNINTGDSSIIAGYGNNNTELYSFIEGVNNSNFSAYSHIEGRANYIDEDSRMAHAEGYWNTIRKNSNFSHIEGFQNVVNACTTAHVEGSNNIASGDNTHVQGVYNISDTKYPIWAANTNYKVGDKIIDAEYKEGYVCIEENSDSEFDENKWLYTGQSTDGAFIIGNGIEEDNRSNALKVTWDGDILANGNVYVKCNNDSTGGIKLATENIIAIQDTQPTGTDTKIWLPETAGTPIQVPTMEDLGDYVQKTDIATQSQAGIVKPNLGFGIGINLNSQLYLNRAELSQIKAGTDLYRPIVPNEQHVSVFYGLAKAAGDTTQAASDNAVGQYTDSAKASIKSMLGIVDDSTGTVDVTGATPTITAVENTRYVCGEVTSLDLTPAASGICIVRFTSGSTVTVLTLPSTVKFPEWFDSTTLETNTIYEICITDGIYGAVMSWAL